MRTVVCALAVLLANSAMAEEEQVFVGDRSVGVVAGEGSMLKFDLNVNLRDAVVSVTGPNGFRAYKAQKLKRSGLNLREFGNLPDGSYQFEVVTIGESLAELASPPLNNGRGDLESKKVIDRIVVGGNFLIKDGNIFMINSALDKGSDKDDKK